MSENKLQSLIQNVIIKINCCYCGNRVKKNVDLKDNQEIDNSTCIDSIKNIIQSNSKFLNNFELELFPYGEFSKKKGRKKWTENHHRVLESCLKLFGRNIQIIRKFIPKFSDKILFKEIEKLEYKSIIKKYEINNYRDIVENDKFDKMLESFGSLEISSQKSQSVNQDFKDFSIDYFINKNKLINNNFTTELGIQSPINRKIKNKSSKINSKNFKTNLKNFNNLNNNIKLETPKLSKEFDDDILESEINGIFKEEKKKNINNFTLEDLIDNSVASVQFNKQFNF